MKIKEGFALQKMGDTYVALYIGEEENTFTGMITMNSVAAYLWNYLESGCTEKELVDVVLDKYAIDENTARKDVKNILDKLIKAEILDV